ALHGVQISKQHIDRASLDTQPITAIDQRPPLTEFRDCALIAQSAHILRIELTVCGAIVYTKIPITVLPTYSQGTGTSKYNCHCTRHCRKILRHSRYMPRKFNHNSRPRLRLWISASARSRDT